MNKASLSFALLIFILAELHEVPFATAAFRAAIGYVAVWALLFVWTAVLWPLLTAGSAAPEPDKGRRVGSDLSGAGAEHLEDLAA
ncbi:MAG TPA: hypothetical protein ENK07_08230 [Bacteroidetes bacterium]|nr:hypothetical protein [Bacteroidota bacterium]